MKVQRALASLVQHLGGWRPYYDEDIKEEDGVETNDEADYDVPEE